MVQACPTTTDDKSDVCNGITASLGVLERFVGNVEPQASDTTNYQVNNGYADVPEGAEAVRVSPESISMWQDGILVVSTSGDFMDSYDEPFTIGSAIPPGDSEFGGCLEHFLGAMDDIGVWERALADEEILALYNAPKSRSPGAPM